MFDCLEQLELFAACFLQLRRTLVDKIPNRLLFVVNKDGILLFLCAQIPAVSINFLLRFLKKIDDFVAVVHIGGCCFQRMNQSAVRIHADVLLVAEVPLVALFDGMSFRITLLFFVEACPSSSLIRLIVNCFFTSLLYLFPDLFAVPSLYWIA